MMLLAHQISGEGCTGPKHEHALGDINIGRIFINQCVTYSLFIAGVTIKFLECVAQRIMSQQTSILQ